MKLNALVCAVILAAVVSASAKDGEPRACQTTFGGQVVCGDLVIGITLEQYEAGLKRRAEEIRAEEAEKRIELRKLVDLTERATSAEQGSLRARITAVEAEKRALEAESKGVADRLTNLQASYDALVQKLAEANATLEAFAPLISKDAFEQAQAMLGRGDVLGAERKFVEIANAVAKVRERADVVEASALFEAGKLAEERIDWRAAYAHYARAAKLQPGSWLYALVAGKLAHKMSDYAAATSFQETALGLVTSELGPDAWQTATALSAVALTHQSLARYAEAETLFRRSIEIFERSLGKEHPAVATGYNNLAGLLQDQGRHTEAEPLIRQAIEITERALGKQHPALTTRYDNLADFLRAQGKYAEAEALVRRAIAIEERVHGKDHPRVAIGYGNLAGLLQAQGKHAEAEALLRRTIEIDEAVFGKHHPHVAASYNNLAVLFREQGRYADAEPLYRRAIEILQTALGPDHPKTLLVKTNYDQLQKLTEQSSRKPVR